MKKVFFVLLMLSAVFTGCEKDEPVMDREKFVGSWACTQTIKEIVNGEIVSQYMETITEKIDAGKESNQVVFNKNTESEVIATISGSQLTIAKQIKIANLNGSPVFVEYVGQGTLSVNNVLSLSYTLDYKDGTVYVVTASLIKY